MLYSQIDINERMCTICTWNVYVNIVKRFVRGYVTLQTRSPSPPPPPPGKLVPLLVHGYMSANPLFN